MAPNASSNSSPDQAIPEYSSIQKCEITPAAPMTTPAQAKPSSLPAPSVMRSAMGAAR